MSTRTFDGSDGLIVTRRTLLGAALAVPFGFPDGTCFADVPEAPSITILDRRVISWKPPLYHGWPTLARRKNGELLLAFSGGRERHLCPFGRLEWMRSKDQGVTWGWPQVLYDGPIDDRDAGVVETAKGSILVTNFTSLAYEAILDKGLRAKAGDPDAFEDPKLLEEWKAAHHRLTLSERKAEVGMYMMRSTDGGARWSSRYPVPLNSPHGPIVLRDGRLLYAGKTLFKDSLVGVCESIDDGLSWNWLAIIPIRPGDDPRQYHELHAVEANDGTLLCQFRNENEKDEGEILQSESKDGGRTWTIPHTIQVWGYPPHLLRLRDGRLLMSYSHRREPFGNQARVSSDHGRTWSQPILLSSDGIGGELGYPSTVECDDGTLVTVWYEVLKDSPLAQLRQARWKWSTPSPR